MAETEQTLPKSLTWGGAFVAALLLLLMLFAGFKMIFGVNDPPLQADPAPTSPPILYCGSTARPITGSTATTTASSTSVPPTTTSAPSTTPPPNSPAPAATAAASAAGCSGVTYSPQLRGAYDPDARMVGLLSIVVPLITTIVAFFFGQHAGASQAQGAIKDKNAMAQAIRDQAKRKGTAEAVLATMAEQGVMKNP